MKCFSCPLIWLGILLAAWAYAAGRLLATRGLERQALLVMFAAWAFAANSYTGVPAALMDAAGWSMLLLALGEKLKAAN